MQQFHESDTENKNHQLQSLVISYLLANLKFMRPRVHFGSRGVKVIICSVPTVHAPDNTMDACFEERLREELRRYPHLTINFPSGTIKSISTTVHSIDTWWVYCWGPTEVQCGVWSCLDERFSRKLRAAEQSARSKWTRFQRVLL